MLPTFELFGMTIKTGNLFLFINYFVSVPISLIPIRKRYGYKLSNAIYYSVLTLVLGVAALHITSLVSNAIMELASGGAFNPYETINSYGLYLFLPPLYLIYCLLFRKGYREMMDYVTPAVCTVETIGKLVCFFEGCCYGPPDEHGLYFQNLGYKAFPVQLYDTIDNAVILVIILILTYTFSKKHKGYLMPIAGMLYSIQKGILEEYRVYHEEIEGNFMGTGRTYWQFFLAVLFACCLIWLIGTIIRNKKGKPDFDTATNIKLPNLKKILTDAVESLKQKKAEASAPDNKNEKNRKIEKAKKNEKNQKNKKSNKKK